MRKADLDNLLEEVLQSQARISDIVFTVKKPIQVISDGRMKEVPIKLQTNYLVPYQTEAIAFTLIGQAQRLYTDLISHGSCDLAYSVPSGQRFRVNIFSQRGSYAIVMRLLSNKLPTIKNLNLPECFFKMSKEKNGIILFTGATGTGKTTSLAAILDDINEHLSLHCITLEDPIEYVHPHKNCTFNQRELGRDFDQFANGLRAALRQAPHVILVGEIRDRETMEIALSASETGHLVFSTLHTMSAAHTVNRIIGMFDKDEEQQIRFRLADAMRWTVGQRLLPKTGGGRVAIFDIMFNNIVIKDLLINGEDENKTFYDMIESGSAYDMQTFDQNIIRLYEQGIINEETSILYSSNRSRVRQGIDYIKSKKGEITSDIDELAVDFNWRKTF